MYRRHSNFSLIIFLCLTIPLHRLSIYFQLFLFADWIRGTMASTLFFNLSSKNGRAGWIPVRFSCLWTSVLSTKTRWYVLRILKKGADSQVEMFPTVAQKKKMLFVCCGLHFYVFYDLISQFWATAPFLIAWTSLTSNTERLLNAGCGNNLDVSWPVFVGTLECRLNLN